MEQINEKIQDTHLHRRAVVYERCAVLTLASASSSLLQARARTLGWDEKDIFLIDQDSGRSGLSLVENHGYKALVADILAGNVGAIFVRDSSRLTRSIDELNTFVRACAGANTLIVTGDEIFAPSIAQDRLLLGLKVIVVNLGGKHRRKR